MASKTEAKIAKEATEGRKEYTHTEMYAIALHIASNPPPPLKLRMTAPRKKWQTSSKARTIRDQSKERRHAKEYSSKTVKCVEKKKGGGLQSTNTLK